MLDGIMLAWFVLTTMSLSFVVIDIRRAPTLKVMKWGFILLTAYTGPIGAFLYVLGCREPLPGLHERYILVRWRQVLGSTMHCVAGDGVGILAGAVIASYFILNRPVEIALEYGLGFGFGWTIFQALFMRGMAGGSYRRALATTFLPEFLSMNLVMSGMMLAASIGRALVGRRLSPMTPEFWFVMSMALLSGFLTAYPINWWLVSKGLKHGMMTVPRPGAANEQSDQSPIPSTAPLSSDEQPSNNDNVPRKQIVWMTVLTIVLIALALVAQGEVKTIIDWL